MKVLITGGTGFIGSNLIKKMIGIHEIVELSRRKGGGMAKGIEQISYEELNRLQKNSNIDAIIHCASRTSVNCDDQEKIMNENIGLAKQVSNLVERCRPRYLAFTSTISVYGKIKDKILRYNSEKIEVDAYGKSKRICEKMIEDACRENECKSLILRLPGIAGKNSHSNLVSKIITSMTKEGKKLKLYNPNNMFNNISSIEEIEKCLYWAFSEENTERHIKTILASRDPIKMIDMVTLMADKLGFTKANNIKWEINTNKPFFTIDTTHISSYGYKPMKTEETILSICKNVRNG